MTAPAQEERERDDSRPILAFAEVVLLRAKSSAMKRALLTAIEAMPGCKGRAVSGARHDKANHSLGFVWIAPEKSHRVVAGETCGPKDAHIYDNVGRRFSGPDVSASKCSRDPFSLEEMLRYHREPAQ